MTMSASGLSDFKLKRALKKRTQRLRMSPESRSSFPAINKIYCGHALRVTSICRDWNVTRWSR